MAKRKKPSLSPERMIQLKGQKTMRRIEEICKETGFRLSATIEKVPLGQGRYVDAAILRLDPYDWSKDPGEQQKQIEAEMEMLDEMDDPDDETPEEVNDDG